MVEILGIDVDCTLLVDNELDSALQLFDEIVLLPKLLLSQPLPDYLTFCASTSSPTDSPCFTTLFMVSEQLRRPQEKIRRKMSIAG